MDEVKATGRMPELLQDASRGLSKALADTPHARLNAKEAARKLEKPQHVHDCDRCSFLGCFNEFDLYHCDQGVFGPTLIARFGPMGDYKSGLVFADTIPELGEAKRRAIAAGLLEAA